MRCPHCRKEIKVARREDTLGRIIRRLNSKKVNDDLFHLMALGGLSAASYYGILVFTGLKDFVDSLRPLSGVQAGLFLLLSCGLFFSLFKIYIFLSGKILNWEDPFED